MFWVKWQERFERLECWEPRDPESWLAEIYQLWNGRADGEPWFVSSLCMRLPIDEDMEFTEDAALLIKAVVRQTIWPRAVCTLDPAGKSGMCLTVDLSAYEGMAKAFEGENHMRRQRDAEREAMLEE